MSENPLPARNLLNQMKEQNQLSSIIDQYFTETLWPLNEWATK